MKTITVEFTFGDSFDAYIPDDEEKIKAILLLPDTDDYKYKIINKESYCTVHSDVKSCKWLSDNKDSCKRCAYRVDV